MGGPSNIDYPSQIFQSTSPGIGTQATIRPIGITIHREGRDFCQAKVDEISKLMAIGLNNVWMAPPLKPGDKAEIAEADTRHQTPRVLVSSPLNIGDRDFAELVDRTCDFVFIVQGKNGSRYFKLMISHTRSDAAGDVLDEAMNGYSVVFSGAMLKTDCKEVVFGRNIDVNNFHLASVVASVPNRRIVGEKKKPDMSEFEKVRKRSSDGKLEQCGIWCEDADRRRLGELPDEPLKHV